MNIEEHDNAIQTRELVRLAQETVKELEYLDGRRAEEMGELRMLLGSLSGYINKLFRSMEGSCKDEG